MCPLREASPFHYDGKAERWVQCVIEISKKKSTNKSCFFSFGEPYGFLPLVKGKANISLRGVCCPTLVERTHLGSAIPWIAKRKHTPLSVFLFFGDPYGNRTHVTTVKGWCLNRLTKGPFRFR